MAGIVVPDDKFALASALLVVQETKRAIISHEEALNEARLRYGNALTALRAICPHDRFEERGYGVPVCVICGIAESELGITMNPEGIGQ